MSLFLSTMQSFWQKKCGFTNSTFQSVDWEALKLASKQVTRSRLHWMIKHTCGVCGVNALLCRWKLREDDRCPSCALPVTAQHVWTCDNEGSRAIWKRTLQELTKWLISVDTEHTLVHTIINNLLPWNERPLPRTQLEGYQDSIGWEIILEGTLPHAWAQHQHSHYLKIGSKKSDKRWLVQLILKLWNTAWDLWEHRNNIAHAINEANQFEAITNKICTIFATNEYPANASHLFTDNMRDHIISANLATKKSWLSNFHAHVKYSLKEQENQKGLTQMRATMRNFLTQTPKS
jgi:hypothetical protein